MPNSSSVSASMASNFVELFPGLVRSELLSDSKLMGELGLAIDGTISFGDKGVGFSRSALFKAIRSAFEHNEEAVCVEDTESDSWSMRVLSGEHPSFSLIKGNEEIINGCFWPLYNDVSFRLSALEVEAKNKELLKEELEVWREALSQATASDDEVSDLLRDFDCTPRHIEDLLRRELQVKTSNISTLVPNSIRYYERLVGKYSGSKSIEEYCNKELKQYFGSRLKDKFNENDFLICTHRSIAGVVSSGLTDEASYKLIASRAIETCHPILLVACLEAGLQRFSGSSPSTLETLFGCMASERTLENLRLFCSMAAFVDGELARLQLFRGMPPFYRRLASLAQSALILKVGMEDKVAFDQVVQWAAQQRQLYFFCQSFVDLIDEPRWLSTYLTAEQFINDLYGRISIACQEAGTCDVVEYLKKELLVGSRLNMYSFLPGPLEGNCKPTVVPKEIASLLGKHIDGEASLESYMVLINSAPFWLIDDKYLERTVSLLESAEHKLAAINDKDSVYQVLQGFARVACMTRSRELAASVVTLSRLYRDYIDVDSEPENYLALGVVAGAAFEDKDGWAEYIGQWCTELAYLPISEEAAIRAGVMLEKLCILEPYLYYTCSKPLDIFKMLSGK